MIQRWHIYCCLEFCIARISLQLMSAKSFENNYQLFSYSSIESLTKANAAKNRSGKKRTNAVAKECYKYRFGVWLVCEASIYKTELYVTMVSTRFHTNGINSASTKQKHTYTSHTYANTDTNINPRTFGSTREIDNEEKWDWLFFAVASHWVCVVLDMLCMSHLVVSPL